MKATRPGGASPGDASVPSKTLTRAKLVESMAALCAARGHEDLQVAAVVERAGVARSTFYEHFYDLERCLVAAVEEAGRRLLAAIEDEARSGGHPGDEAIRGLVSFTREDPGSAWALFVEAPGSGARALAARARVVEDFAGHLRQGWTEDEERPAPRVPPERVSGGIFRLVGMRLCTGAACGEDFLEGLGQWLDTYRAPSATGPLVVLPSFGGRAGRDSLPTIDQRLPDPRAPRRAADPHVSKRQRILDATMASVAAFGYERVSVAGIAALAGVSRKDFYREFRGRSEAAIAAAEQFFVAAMSACAGGFFSDPSGDWRTRIWNCGVSLLSFFADNPRGAYYGFVTGCAIGREAMEMIYARTLSFTIFLEEASRTVLTAAPPQRLVHEALAATMFERAFVELEATGKAEGLIGSLPEMGYLVLTPFLGAQDAVDFVQAAASGLDGDEEPSRWAPE